MNSTPVNNSSKNKGILNSLGLGGLFGSKNSSTPAPNSPAPNSPAPNTPSPSVGGRRRKSRKGSRKSRKGSRKNRKGSRKNRKH